ncbi:MAG: ATP-binding protein [Haliscomenobacter sp.]|nr:ATP-binding protein [Haliscomenobacter sp.]
MTSPNKKAIISAISNLGDILILLEQLLRKANLSSIIREFDNVILASENASFSPRKLLFVPSLEELSGKNSRIHEILKKLDIERFDVAYIISLNRKEISDYYKRNIQAQFLSLRFEYWNLNDLIEKIDTHFPEYWGHTDTFIKPYEDLFISEVEEDNELKCLKLDKKYIDMLDIFIEPRISIIISDEKDSSIVFTRSFNREKIVASGNYILTGDAGTGKSTLQKKIGKEIVIRNAARDKKTLPILIRQLDIVANSDSIEKAIDSQLLKAFTDFDLKKVFRDYELLILIDSIDEFSKDKKAKILADIQRLSTDFDLRYVISTRDDHYLLDGLEVKKGI